MYSHFNAAQRQLSGIQAIDFYLAKELTQVLDLVEHKALFHTIIATSEALRQGHSCLQLDNLNGQCLWQHTDDEQPILGSGFEFDRHLSEIISGLDLAPQHNQPLVYEQGRLYLRRYWQFEVELAAALRERMTQYSQLPASDVKGILAQLFPHHQREQSLDWQYIAVANALNKSFSLIAGGPGTGKTYTVTKLLAALVMLSPQPIKIAMAAPTGKAAQRLSESIVAAIEGFRQHALVDTEVLQRIPTEAATLHRLLGVIPNNPNFKYNAEHQLELDVLLIDEVSMVDLPMMARVFRALPPACKVIMLGDADQLPSVAAGSILTELAPRPHTGYSPSNQAYLQQISGYDAIPQATETAADYLTLLQKSHRFDGEGGIGLLAQQVIKGEAAQSWHDLTHTQSQEVQLLDTDIDQQLARLVMTHYTSIFSAQTADEALTCLNQFRILVATRKGELGVERLNQRVEAILRKHGKITGNSELYAGRPIMICENHYDLRLFNGDVGILWPNNEHQLMAVFPSTDGMLRYITPSRLPKYETVFAMTIHKTQGSEFSGIAMLLGEQGEKLLSRELIYTGLTRAKKHIALICQKSTWIKGVEKRVTRFSGLGWRLHL